MSDILKQINKHLHTVGGTRKLVSGCNLFSAKKNLYSSLPLHTLSRRQNVLSSLEYAIPLVFLTLFFLTLLLTTDSCENSEAFSLGEELISNGACVTLHWGLF